MGHPCRREAIGNFLNLPGEKEFKECVILISNEKLSARKRELHFALKKTIESIKQLSTVDLMDFDRYYHDIVEKTILEAEEILNREYIPNE